MKNIAIIPVRMGSTRVKRKNAIDFLGKPLFYYTYLSAKKTKLFDEIVISTESKEVLNMCRELGIDVGYLRPAALADGSITLADVCKDVLDYFMNKNKVFDNLCLLWATSPLRDHTDIVNSYEILKSDGAIEGVVGVTEYGHSPYCALTENLNGYVEPVMAEEFWKGSEGWPKTFVDCGSIAWVKMNAFQLQKTWLPRLTKAYVMPRYKGVDLDTPDDLELLRLYFEKYYQG